MAEYISYQNVEYLTLQHFGCELSTAISADLTQVATKLFSRKVISLTQLNEAQLQTKTKQERASELVTQVIVQVRVYPEKYDAFLKALEESDVQKVVKDVHHKYANTTPQVKL